MCVSERMCVCIVNHKESLSIVIVVDLNAILWDQFNGEMQLLKFRSSLGLIKTSWSACLPKSSPRDDKIADVELREDCDQLMVYLKWLIMVVSSPVQSRAWCNIELPFSCLDSCRFRVLRVYRSCGNRAALYDTWNELINLVHRGGCQGHLGHITINNKCVGMYGGSRDIVCVSWGFMEFMTWIRCIL